MPTRHNKSSQSATSFFLPFVKKIRSSTRYACFYFLHKTKISLQDCAIVTTERDNIITARHTSKQTDFFNIIVKSKM